MNVNLNQLKVNWTPYLSWLTKTCWGGGKKSASYRVYSNCLGGEAGHTNQQQNIIVGIAGIVGILGILGIAGIVVIVGLVFVFVFVFVFVLYLSHPTSPFMLEPSTHAWIFQLDKIKFPCARCAWMSVHFWSASHAESLKNPSASFWIYPCKSKHRQDERCGVNTVDSEFSTAFSLLVWTLPYLYVCNCMIVWLYDRMNIWMYVWMYVCMHTCMDGWMDVWMDV